MKQSVQKILLAVVVLCAVCTLAVLMPVQADSFRWCLGKDPAKCLGLGLDGAVEGVKRKTGSRVLSAETIQVKGRDVHRIKVITKDGRVRQLYVDVKTGKLLNRKR